MAAPTPSAFWLKATDEQRARAAHFIGEFQQHARIHICRLQKLYPGDDVEPRVMMALYKAAYAWLPDRAGFYCWFMSTIHQEMSVVRKKRMYRKKHSIRETRISNQMVDDRYLYW